MEPSFRIDKEELLCHRRWLRGAEMAREIRVERLMIPRSRPINGMKTRQDGIDVVVYVPIPIPIPIRVRLACAKGRRVQSLWSSLSQDLGPWISPQYPSYPTLSPLSEATTCQYRSRQVVKDRHKQTQTKQSQSFPNCTYDQYLQSTYCSCVIHQS